jgi:epsin
MEAVLTSAATSNDPWGPVGSDMAEIAQITFNR